MLFEWGYREDLLRYTGAVERSSLATAGARELNIGFTAVIYSLDPFIPLVDLHEGRQWIPDTEAGAHRFSVGRYPVRNGGLLRAYLWIHIVAGWILSTLIVAAVTGIIRRST